MKLLKIPALRPGLIMLLIILTSAFATLAQSVEGRVVAATLNVRSAPVIDPANVVGRLPAQTRVAIEGRTQANDWFYIRNSDGTLTGWASSGYIALEGGTLDAIPVVSEANVPITSDIPAVESTPFTIVLPEASLTRIMETPIFHNMTSRTVYSIFARGQRRGNNPRVFMKVGDSVTATQPFLYGFSDGNYNLGPYADLQPTVDFFNVSPGRDLPSSWIRNSVSAVNGFVSGAVFDGTWSPEYCLDLVPLECEYDLLRPSVAVVLFGGQDVRLFDAGFFQRNMRQIAADLKALGVIPVFTTFPMHASYRPEQTILFNTIVLDVAAEEDIPVINLYRALQSLPDGGAKYDDVVHLTQGEVYFDFNGDEALYGVTLRNLLTLQALDILRREVLQ